MDPEVPSTEPPSWLSLDDAPPEPEEARSRSRTLYVAAALPWVVVAVLLGRPAGRGPDAGPEAGPASLAVSSPSPASTIVTTDPVGSAEDRPSGLVTSSGALVAVGDDEARAVAVVVARRWLTTVGPGAVTPASGGEAGAGAYAEHLVVEGVDHPAPGAAVVTVRAVVLRVDGDTYGEVEIRRVAVPLRFDADGASPAGEPYLLPTEEPIDRPFELEPVTDPDLLLQAGEALVEAGYDVEAVQALHRTGSWPLVVTADVRSAGGTVERLQVWLRVHLGRLVVAGTRPRPAPPAPSTQLPSSAESDTGADAGADAPDDHEEVAP